MLPKKIAEYKIDLEGKVPEELLEFFNKVKKTITQIKLILILDFNIWTKVKKKFFLNLVNDPEFYAKSDFGPIKHGYFCTVKEIWKTPVVSTLWYKNEHYRSYLMAFCWTK